MVNPTFTQCSIEDGRQILAQRDLRSRKANGQFITPAPLAHFMAMRLGPIHPHRHVLDPAMGSGTLLCAVIDRLIAAGEPHEIWLDGFELDAELFASAQSILSKAAVAAAQQGIRVHLNLLNVDFVLNGLRWLRPALLEPPIGRPDYQYIIANPPYFKINGDDPRRRAVQGLLAGHSNMYTLFMGLAARMLSHGQACFLVPRSFCSGAYFKRFRYDLLSCAAVHHVHLFDARDEAFREDDVLQENIVITFGSPTDLPHNEQIIISSSPTTAALETAYEAHTVTRSRFVSRSGVLRLPTGEFDDVILDTLDQWPGCLDKSGLKISTGPVVPFRAKAYLTDDANIYPVAPLLWMQHVTAQRITWPLTRRFHKPQYLHDVPETLSLLVQRMNYVLLRRFSTKESPRRIIAAPFLSASFDYPRIGLENHLNYIYRAEGDMTEAEVIGLAAWLNSEMIDRYFRISNGNTQVNASELRELPLPPLSVIEMIGQALMTETEAGDSTSLMLHVLHDHGLIPAEFLGTHKIR